MHFCSTKEFKALVRICSDGNLIHSQILIYVVIQHNNKKHYIMCTFIYPFVEGMQNVLIIIGFVDEVLHCFIEHSYLRKEF